MSESSRYIIITTDDKRWPVPDCIGYEVAIDADKAVIDFETGMQLKGEVILWVRRWSTQYLGFMYQYIKLLDTLSGEIVCEGLCLGVRHQ